MTTKSELEKQIIKLNETISTLVHRIDVLEQLRTIYKEKTALQDAMIAELKSNNQDLKFMLANFSVETLN